jgi:hypothetical protein
LAYFNLKEIFQSLNYHFRNARNLVIFTVLSLAIILLLSHPSIIEKSSSVAMEDCNCVAFRLTNIQDYFNNNAQVALMDIFLKKNHSLVVSLVMNYTGRDSSVVDKVLEGSKRGLFELAVNGWDFIDYSKLSEKAQVEQLISANHKMQNLFGVSSKIFVPPYESFNNVTIDAMGLVGMKILSSNIGIDRNQVFISKIQKNPTSDNKTIYHLPAMTSFYSYNETGHIVKVPVQQLLDDVTANIARFGYTIINFDPYFFVSDGPVPKLKIQQINNLSNIIDLLLKNNIHIETFSKITSSKTNFPVTQDNNPLSSPPATNTTAAS